ncbi:MAG: ADP-ribosylglycohydrolase family protein [Armatimonadetes bacterium]|nr:ADP-ribosylglycohydrolase family protein [Armatimonadota bacterium]
MDRTWLYLSRDDLLTERLQAEQEGIDLSPFVAEFDSLLSQEEPDQRRAEALLDAIQTEPIREGYPFVEPNDLQNIRDECAMPVPTSDLGPRTSGLDLDRLHGTWLGRCCGCMLGKVTEGWRRPTMEGFLKDTGQWPLRGYISKGPSEEIRTKHGVAGRRFWIDDHREMPEDDDLNYTVSGFEILRRYGRDFTPDQVAQFWMSDIPILHVCTAERVAYKNFVNGVLPPASASFRNPYREWIGAQIRADFWGYANPGEPWKAAEFAWRDASISHVKNGIYGEMWAAAMIAAAFTAESPQGAIEAGLACIPQKSRLADALRRVIAWHGEGIDASEAQRRIHTEWDETRSHDWCHTISNAMIVAIALLWGEGDFGRTLCLAVETCFDTDCNGATSGSVLGAMQGASKLPKQWTEPLHDTLETGVQGYHRVSIKGMAERTMELTRRES